MNQSDTQFLHILQQRAKEQASVEASSPLPELTRPIASIVGEHTPLVLLGVSFVAGSLIAVGSFSAMYQLYLRGILGWLVAH